MHAKTRSAPRTPSSWRRFIQSATRFGNSRRTWPQSPIGASSGRGRQIEVDARGQSGVIAGVRRRLPISVAIGHEPVIVQPPWIMTREQGFPAFGRLVSEDDTARYRPLVATRRPRRMPAASFLKDDHGLSACRSPSLARHERFLHLWRQPWSGERVTEQRMTGNVRFSQTRKKSERSA